MARFLLGIVLLLPHALLGQARFRPPEGQAAGTYFLTLHVEQLPPTTTVRPVAGE